MRIDFKYQYYLSDTLICKRSQISFILDPKIHRAGPAVGSPTVITGNGQCNSIFKEKKKKPISAHIF